MKTSLFNIYDKIKNYSHKIDNLSLLIDQNWIKINEDNASKVVFIFRNNGQLLISENGIVEKAKWEHITTNSLLIDRNQKSFFVKNSFFDPNIIAISIDNTYDHWILVNEDKYKGHHSFKAIGEYLQNKYIENTPTPEELGLPRMNKISNIEFNKKGFNLRMGRYIEYIVHFSNDENCKINERISDGKYFVFGEKDIIVFPFKSKCLEFLEGKIN